VQVQERSGAAQVAVSATGNLAFIPRRTFAARQLVLVDRHGQTQPVADDARIFENPRLSPDGSRIVVDIVSNVGPDVWVYDIGRAVWTQLTFNGMGSVPIWTPDGRSITYIALVGGRPNLFRKAADGSGSAELLSDAPGNPHSWSPDGRWLARASATPGVGLELLAMDATHTTSPFPATPEGSETGAPAISPDGRWITYVTTDSGRRQVYVRPFPEGESRWLVSSDGGTQPMWARSGRELFYRNGDRMMAVAITTTPSFKADRAHVLFEGHFEGAAVRSAYDVMPDGEHFVMLKAVEPQPVNKQINVVLHWSEELKERVSAK